MQERFLSFDAAFYSFSMLNLETFYQNNARYICYLTQCFAVLGIKADLSLQTVLTIYSVTFAFWYYLMFLFVRYVLNDVRGIMLLIFTLCLATRYKHYAGHTEVIIAEMFSVLLFVWLTADKSKMDCYKQWMYWAGLIGLCFILFFIHPVIVVPLMMILGADVIWHSRWKDGYNWASIAFVGFTFALRFVTLNSYETGRVDSIFSVQDVIFHPENFTHVYDIMCNYLFSEYVILLPVFILSLLVLAYKKRYFMSLYFLLCFIVLVLMNLLSHAYLSAYIYIMIDGYMGMLGMVIGLSIIYAFEDYVGSKIFLMLSALLIIISCYQINTKHHFFTDRLAAIERTFELQSGSKKLYVERTLFDWDKMWYPYGIHVEALMLTCMDGKAACKTMYVGPKELIKDKYTTVHDTIQVMDRSSAVINDRFFKWPSEPYTVAKEVGW